MWLISQSMLTRAGPPVGCQPVRKLIRRHTHPKVRVARKMIIHAVSLTRHPSEDPSTVGRPRVTCRLDRSDGLASPSDGWDRERRVLALVRGRVAVCLPCALPERRSPRDRMSYACGRWRPSVSTCRRTAGVRVQHRVSGRRGRRVRVWRTVNKVDVTCPKLDDTRSETVSVQP